MPDDDALKRCEAEKRNLTAENRELQRASESFGELAERLNRQLHGTVESAPIGERRAGASARDEAIGINPPIAQSPSAITTFIRIWAAAVTADSSFGW